MWWIVVARRPIPLVFKILCPNHVVPRPSTVQNALSILQAGNNVENGFCQSFYTCCVGQACIQAAQDIVERGAADLLSDSSFHTAFNGLQTKVANLPKRVDAEHIKQSKEIFERSFGKVVGALQAWSPARSDEQWAHVVESVAFAQTMAQHAFAIALTKLVQAALAPAKVANERGEESKISQSAKVDAKAHEDLKQSVVEKMGEINSVGECLIAVVHGIGECDYLLNAGADSMDPSTMLSHYEQWLLREAAEQDGDDDDEERCTTNALPPMTKPFLAICVGFLKSVATTTTSLESSMPLNDLRNTVPSMPPSANAMVVLELLSQGLITVAVRRSFGPLAWSVA